MTTENVENKFSKLIPTIVGILTIIGVTLTGINSVNGLYFRVENLEHNRTVLLDNLGELNTKIDALNNKLDAYNSKLIEHTIVLNKFEERIKVLQERQAENR